MATVALMHNQLCGTDGVSLEVDKWRAVLERMGHRVHYIAGNEHPGVITVPELSFEHPEIERLLTEATAQWTGTYRDGAALLEDAERVATVLEHSLLDMLDTHGIDFLMPHNLLSIGYNLPAVIALTRLIVHKGIPASGHWHDFWWEGEQSGEVNPTCAEVRSFFEEYAPPLAPNARHTVINSFGRQGMLERKGYDPDIIPNVFDFDQHWAIDDYNRGFREAFGIDRNDIVFLQAARVLDRKAVELAIDVVAEVNRGDNRRDLESNLLYDGRPFTSSNRIILLCAGYVETFGISGNYRQALEGHAAEKGVDIRFVGHRVKHSRGADNEGTLYSLFQDAYPQADMVTYCSVWEGFGNQFLEAVCADTPVVLFEYPVYAADLKPLGFDVVSLGDTFEGTVTQELLRVSTDKVQATAADAVQMLIDPDRRSQAVTTNRRIAEEHFSLNALERHLARAVGAFATA